MTAQIEKGALLAGIGKEGNPTFSEIRSTIRERQEWSDVDEFLTIPIEGYSDDTFVSSPIAIRFQTITDQLDSHPDLVKRATKVLKAVHKLVYIRQEVQKFPHVPRKDANLIQAWVDDSEKGIQGEELPILATAMFPEWASRLDEGKDIPHITQANQWVAKRVVFHLKIQKIKDAVIFDAGAGTGKTIMAVRSALRSNNIRAKITGVELAPELAEKARENLKQGAAWLAAIREGNVLVELDKVKNGTLDAFTMVYAIHHLSYQDQKQLLHMVMRKLKPGGVIAIADPTGRSDFNLKHLLINEPEAVFADFNRSVEQVTNMFGEVGFQVREDWVEKKEKEGQKKSSFIKTNHQVESPPESKLTSTASGDILKQGLLGYALVGSKPG